MTSNTEPFEAEGISPVERASNVGEVVLLSTSSSRNAG